MILFVDDGVRLIKTYLEVVDKHLMKDGQPIPTKLVSDVDNLMADIEHKEAYLDEVTVFVLDLMMPHDHEFTTGDTEFGYLTGIHVLAALKEAEVLKEKPIFLLTNAEKNQIESAIEANIDLKDFYSRFTKILEKPSTSNYDLVDEIHKVLNP